MALTSDNMWTLYKTKVKACNPAINDTILAQAECTMKAIFDAIIDDIKANMEVDTTAATASGGAPEHTHTLVANKGKFK